MLGRDGNIMDREYSPSLRCSRRWKYSGWGALPIMPTILVPKVAWQMGSTPYCMCPYQPKKLLYVKLLYVAAL
jgi:hypothetical protein